MLVRFLNFLLEKINNNKLLKYIYYLSLAVYPFLLFIFYQKWGTKAIGLHTNIALPVYIIFISDQVQKLTASELKPLSALNYIAKVYLIIEVCLIIVNPANIKATNYYGQYISQYETKESSYYHLRKPHQSYKLSKSEYSFTRTANSLGIPDNEWKLPKEKNTIRILCLGDSFTEGDGAHFDSSYVSFLRRSLQKKYHHVEVLNAGRCGSDPFFDFKLLKDSLLQFKPDIVLQSFTENDLYFDMAIRGGYERFQADKTLKFRHKYWWEPVYAMSYISRIFFYTIGGYDKNLIQKNEYQGIIQEMKGKSVQLFTDYQQLAEQNNFQLIVFSFPFKTIYSEENIYDQFYKDMNDRFKGKNITYYSLKPCYESTYQAEKTTFDQYYWVKDGHHNAKGYEMMAKCLENILLSDTSTAPKFRELNE